MSRLFIVFITALWAVIAQASLSVEFVTPSIVRVQWSAAGGHLEGNATGACIYGKCKVRVKTEETGDCLTLMSDQLIVKIDKKTDAVTFIDRRTGRTLLREQWRKSEPVVQERIVYDDATARMEETANGKVTVKDIIRRDTIGESTRYI